MSAESQIAIAGSPQSTSEPPSIRWNLPFGHFEAPRYRLPLRTRWFSYRQHRGYPPSSAGFEPDGSVIFGIAATPPSSAGFEPDGSVIVSIAPTPIFCGFRTRWFSYRQHRGYPPSSAGFEPDGSVIFGIAATPLFCGFRTRWFSHSRHSHRQNSPFFSPPV